MAAAAAMTIEHSVLHSELAGCVLGFLPPSLMVRGTCRMFSAIKASEKHQTAVADATTSGSLVEWAINAGLDPELAHASCLRHGSGRAAEGGHLEILKWARADGCRWNEQTCSGAAKRGHLAVLQWARDWAHTSGCAWDAETCSRAAMGGHLELLHAIEAHEADQEHHTVAADAVDSATLIEWAVRNGLDPELAQNSCIRYGNLEGLRRLRSLFDLPLVEDHSWLAAGGGHLELVWWLWARANGCPWNESTTQSAAAGGHLEVLQWACANGCFWDEWLCSVAAAHGRLEEGEGEEGGVLGEGEGGGVVLAGAAANGALIEEEPPAQRLMHPLYMAACGQDDQ
ncbi:hypothetical protein JKP88DRAFT_330616 [Tribonema minus]|uniref:Ankyrin repeat protein n=1 Tax=Tribonema minus TaxID=303371 RepID=A0A835YQA0_9STRA|nr:hypothetical protein JKP88DRAFT_330616 [Tribonema minus]